jgi:hypothetical protein
MTPHFRPAWLIVDRPPIFSKGKIIMTIIDKLISRKPATDPHAERLAAISKLDSDVMAAIGTAEKAGVAVYTIIEMLERFEQSQRFRLAANQRF